jgi:hypothetical protein
MSNDNTNSSQLQIDPDQIERHLNLLDEEAETFDLWHYSENGRGKAGPFAYDVNNPEPWLSYIQSLHDQGQAIAVVVNKMRFHGVRNIEGVERIRAVFIDDDAKGARPDKPWPLEPHLIVETSPGKRHVYWLVDGLAIDQFDGVMACMVDHWGADKGAKDAARILRLAGTIHAKDPDDPHLVRIVHESGEPPYTAEQILAAFPPPERKRRPTRQQKAKASAAGGTTAAGEAPAAEVADDETLDILRWLNPDMERPDWITVGMGLKSAGVSFDVFDRWSAGELINPATGEAWGSKKYGTTQTVWDSFKRDGVGMGTVVMMAREAGMPRRGRNRPSDEDMFAGAPAAPVDDTFADAPEQPAPEPPVDGPRYTVDAPAIDEVDGEVCQLLWITGEPLTDCGDGTTTIDRARMHDNAPGDFGRRVAQAAEATREANIDCRAAERRYVSVRVSARVADLQAPASQRLMTYEAVKHHLDGHKTQTGKDDDGNPVFADTYPLWKTSSARMTVDDEGYHPAQGRIFAVDGQRFLNAFWLPEHPHTYAEDRLGPFFAHVAYLFPDPANRAFFLNYLATKVQRPEVRATVVPLHLAPSHGTGRGWLVKVLESLFGAHHVAAPKLETVAGIGNDGQYQDYLHRTLWCVVHEVRMTRDRYGVDNQVRDRLTESRLQMNLKYGTNGTYDCFANFLLFSNHHDALVIPDEDRRLWVSGMDGEPREAAYYGRLYAWLADPANIAQLWWHLRRRPARHELVTGRAPRTPERAAMIEAAQSDLEVVVRELVSTWRAEGFELFTMRQLRVALSQGYDIEVLHNSKEEKQIQHVLRDLGIDYGKRCRMGHESARPWLLVPGASAASWVHVEHWIRSGCSTGAGPTGTR